MLLVAAVTLWSMIEQLIGYFADARWLLAVMGSLVLVLDVWVLLEGLRMLASERSKPPVAQTIAES
jgi:carbon starvation protein